MINSESQAESAGCFAYSCSRLSAVAAVLVLLSHLCPHRQRSPANSNTRLLLRYIFPRISHKQGFIFCAHAALFSAAQHPGGRYLQHGHIFPPFCLFQTNPFLLQQQTRGFATCNFRSLRFIWISYYSRKKVQLSGKIWAPLSGLGATLKCILGAELLLLSALFRGAQA